jgi:hypothetical protein
MDKCGCSMTAVELLQANIAHQKPKRMLLIVDWGNGWDVTMYGPESAGRPSRGDPDCITMPAILERTEELLVNLRRQSDDVRGEVVTDPVEIARLLSGKPQNTT